MLNFPAGTFADDTAAPWGSIFASDHLLFHVGTSRDEIAAQIWGGFVYLATPYSREVLRQGSYSQRASLDLGFKAAFEAAFFARLGVVAFAPIAQAALMVAAADQFGGPSLDPLDPVFWEKWCAPFLAAARAVVVPDALGWGRSVGILREVEWALSRNIPVYVMARGR